MQVPIGGWKKFIHVGKKWKFYFAKQKNNICSVTGDLPLKNCVMHIICHYLEANDIFTLFNPP